MKSSIAPMAEVPVELVRDYLVEDGLGRGLRESEVNWKYYDEEFNQGRERGYVWFKDGRVRGFIGWIPAKVATPGGDRDMVWTCDWSVENPDRNPGLGILLLARVQKNYGFVGGVGGSADTNSIVPQMRTRTIAGNAVQLRCPLRLSLVLERLEAKRPGFPKLSDTAVGRIKLPRRRVRRSRAVSFSDGVDVAALQPASDQCRVRYEAAHLSWLGRYPEADFETAYVHAGPGAAGALLWRMHRKPHRWRMAIRCDRDGATLVEPLLAGVLERLATTSASIVSTIVSSHDRANLKHLKRQGFIIAETFKITQSEVTDDLEYGSIEGWNSLAHVSLMLQIENIYDVEIDEDTMIELTTVRAIKDYVRRVTA